jgi:uroporphyrinogen decarboxylase
VNVEPRPPAGWQAPDFAVYYADETLPAGTEIREDGVAMIPGSFYHFQRHHSPLRNATSFGQIEDYPVPEQADWQTDHMAGQVAAAHARGRVAEGWIGHMYETAWQIRGYEQFLMDMIEQPEWAHCLLEKLFRQNLTRIQAAARAGVDFIRCGDDVANQNAMMFSVPMWRDLMLSRWAKAWAAALAIKPDLQVFYHSDGNITPIIDELLEAGVTMLNPVQPECLDPATVRRKYPDLNLYGTIGTQSTMPFGTPEAVRACVRERIETCGAAGRLILEPTHVLEPEVPIANIEAYAQAARDS